MPEYTANYSLPKPNVNSADDEDLWGDQLNTGMDLIDAQMKATEDAVAALSAVPIGAPIPYFGSNAPINYLLCYGQTIGKTGSGADLQGAEYEALFDVVKNCAPNTGAESFSGNDTAVVPDLRGYVIAGKDNMGGTSANRLTDQAGGLDGDVLGDTGGAETHTLTEAQLPDVTLEVQDEGAAISLSLGTVGGGTYKDIPQETTAGGATNRLIVNFGNDEAHNNVQPTIILSYIVRYQ